MAKREPKLFEPWAPPVPTHSEVAAVKACFEGRATEQQQRDAMAYIVNKACATYEDQFCPGDEGRRNTDYALGKRRVGLHLVSLLHTPLKNFRDKDAAPTEQP